MLFAKAQEKGCELVLPVDFQTACKINKDGSVFSDDRPTSRSVAEENSATNNQKNTTQSKNNKNSNPPPAEAEQPKVVEPSPEVKCWQENPSLHWSDVMIKVNKAQIVDLEEQLAQRGNNVCDKKSTVPQSANQTESGAKTPAEEPPAETKERVVLLNPEEYLLGYGPKTLSALKNAIKTSFKVFWDGSISMYMDTALSSANNKDFLNALLEIRTDTQHDEEPPVTLIHGAETEQTLRKTLLRIKIDQQEALEAMQKAQRENVGDSDADEDMEVSESKAEISTFQDDLETICDFMVSDTTLFTTKLL